MPTSSPITFPKKACIDSLLDFRTKTIVIARDLTEKEKAYLKSEKKLVRSNRIAVDAIALIVNPEILLRYFRKRRLAKFCRAKSRDGIKSSPASLVRFR